MASKFNGDVKIGSTGIRIPFQLRKAADSTEFTGGTSSTITVYYSRDFVAPVSVTLTAMATNTTAWSSGAIMEEDSTKAKGAYLLDAPDACWATGANWVKFSIFASGTFVEHFWYTLGVRNASDITLDANGRVDLGNILGTPSAGAAGYVGIDWGHVNAPTTVVALSGTTVGTVTTLTGYTTPPTAAANATAVWQDLISGSDFTAAGSIGKLLSTFTFDGSGFVKANAQVVSDKTGYSLSTAPPTAAAISSALLDTVLTGHTTADTVGLALKLANAWIANKKTIVADVLTIYDVNGTTVLATITLAPSGGPYTSQT